jgi:hypothetical protein
LDANIFMFMATTVHIPKPVLDAADRRAKALGISRNRLIVRALERELADASAWTPGFFEALEHSEPGDDAAVDDMLAAIRRGRSTKGPVRL